MSPASERLPAAAAPAAAPATEAELPGVALVVALQRVLATGRGEKRPGAEADLEALVAAIQAAHQEHGGAAIRIDLDHEELYFDERLVTSRRHGRAVSALLSKLRQRGVAELRFARPLTKPEVTTFTDLVLRSAAGLEPVAACRKIVEGLWSTGLRGTVDLISLEQYGHAARAIKVDGSAYLRLAYARLLTVYAESLRHAQAKELRRHFVWKLSKAVQGLVSMAETRERELLHFVRAARGADGFLIRHPVNTCVLSVLLGQRLGLPKTLLAQVGLAGLLCWSGKARTRAAVVNKPPAARTPQEAAEYALHPYRAVGAVLEQRRFEEPLLLAALVASQLEPRKGCPPRRKPLPEVHPLAQLVALCEAFDLRLTPGKDGKAPTAGAALDAVLRARPFDPTLVQLFAALVGAERPTATGERVKRNPTPG